MGRKLYNIICETSSTIEAVKENVFLVNSSRINCHPTKVNPKKTTLDIKVFKVFKASTSTLATTSTLTSTGIARNSYWFRKCILNACPNKLFYYQPYSGLLINWEILLFFLLRRFGPRTLKHLYKTITLIVR